MKQQGSVLLIVMVVLSVMASLSIHSLQKQKHYLRLVKAQQNQANNLLAAENLLLQVIQQNNDLWQRSFEQHYRSCYRSDNRVCDDDNLQLLLNDEAVLELFAEYKPSENNGFWQVLLHYEKDVRLVLDIALKPKYEQDGWQYYD